jgi:hypothetical protein
MNCTKCNSDRLMVVKFCCPVTCKVTLDSLKYKQYDYIPSNINMGNSDMAEFTVCADCGYMVGNWPLPINAHIADVEQ